MAPSAVADIRSTYGASFIGLLISVALFGMTIIQGWIYFFRKKDPISLKVFVAILIALDTLHTVLCIYGVYWYLILNFGNVESLDINMWAANLQPEIIILVGYLVQIFYARRVYIISRNIIIPILVVALGALALSMGLLFTVKSFFVDRYSHYNSLVWIAVVGQSATALADILIAGSMCWYLYHKKTGIARTDSIIMTLMTYSINSGLLTSILATVTVIFFVIVPTTSLIWQAIFWTSGKCYVNSLLAMLNSRDYLRERSTSNISESNRRAYNKTSVLQSKAFYKSNKTRTTAVTVDIHRTNAMDFAGESDNNMDSVVELGKLQGIANPEHATSEHATSEHEV
ncbi:hypothetical protein BC827DRAFT_1192271 [Russula dissimulans]|nr:hypothetical protein BC827DRAFT_1192271 [Russula dissimulans]